MLRMDLARMHISRASQGEDPRRSMCRLPRGAGSDTRAHCPVDARGVAELGRRGVRAVHDEGLVGGEDPVGGGVPEDAREGTAGGQLGPGN